MPHTSPVYVLGTGLSHDGSVCLLKDGRIEVAVEKERITRVKHDGHNDTEAIEYCLAAANIRLHDVALVVQNALHSRFDHGNDWFRGPRLLDETVRTVTISHHLAHAYAAAATSPFDEATVIVIDGSGSSLDHCVDLDGATVPVRPEAELAHGYFEKDSCYSFRDGRLTPVFKDFSPWGRDLQEGYFDSSGTLHSIGGLYWAATMYVFGDFTDPGKLMGLAPYGKRGVHDFPIFDLRDDRVFLNRDWMARFRRPSRSAEQFKRDFQYYADLARWIQDETERAILYVISSRQRMAPSDNLVYCGGVALNAVANRRILETTKFKKVYIQPAAGDNGISIGCAYYGWLNVLGRERVGHDGSTYLGRQYGMDEVDAAIARHRPDVLVTVDPSFVKTTASLLGEGHVVAWFQGGSEFGPRALGHRSILALPSKDGARDFINRRIKFREDFRPFAPSVTIEESVRYFECDYDSPYMILTANVRPEWRNALSQVTHVDGSARVQTVTRESEPVYHELLREMKARTGHAVLLNTSLNRKDQPIVETPAEAMEFFLSCDLDVLVIGNRIVRKRPASALQKALKRSRTLLIGGARRLAGRVEREIHAKRPNGNGYVPPSSPFSY